MRKLPDISCMVLHSYNVVMTQTSVLWAVLIALPLLSAQEPPVEGNPKSAVRVVVYEDLQCPDCTLYRKMLDEKLLPKYGNQVAFEHRDFPLPKHKWAKPAAIAARHFDREKPALGIEFRRWVMANQTQITPDNFEAKITEWAVGQGMEGAKLKSAMQNPGLAKLVDDEYEEGVARGIARTPTVLVNGEPFIETFTLEQISKGIDAALAAVSSAK
ncbi:MAG: thioredoxin domain-containing protein [Bryobacteraceae bacterium]|nr:thioredoxin domain-containing protein [Bryobacteraceae bacterium]